MSTVTTHASANDERGSQRRNPSATSRPLDITKPEGRTDTANGRRFAASYGDQVRYSPPWRKWLVWDGRRWQLDESNQAAKLAKDLSDLLWREARKTDHPVALQFAAKSADSSRVTATLKMASSEPALSVSPNQLDSSPWLFNCRSGTVDLRTGHHRSHDRADYITQIAPVEFDRDAVCPQWLDFLNVTMRGSSELVEYLRRLVGYSLTGLTTEHVLPFLFGVGANGKSTFVTTVMRLLGEDYSLKAATDLLLAKRNSHPTERADLFRKRFVACVEADDGRRLAEALVKELTGGDRIRARRMREDFWEFDPTHTVWLAANHKPTVCGTDHGIWRRLKLVPFEAIIPDRMQDKELPTKLEAELPGILNWAIRGCLDWREHGLAEPACVRVATGDYRAEMDVVGGFLDDCCEIAENAESRATSLYKSYRDWCESNGEEPITQRRFGSRLSERGIGTRRGTGGQTVRVGVRLVSEQ